MSINCLYPNIWDDNLTIQQNFLGVKTCLPCLCATFLWVSCAQSHYGHIISNLQVFETSSVSFFTVDFCRKSFTHFWSTKWSGWDHLPQSIWVWMIVHDLYVTLLCIKPIQIKRSVSQSGFFLNSIPYINFISPIYHFPFLLKSTTK